MKTETERKTRVWFAEFAESLGVRTDQIAVVRQEPSIPVLTVVWTDNDDPNDRDAIATVFHREPDGRLVRHKPDTSLPGFFDHVEKTMAELDRLLSR